MKKWSRLTAFMLAFAIMLSNASGALALVEVNYDTLLQWIQSVKEANGLGDVVKLIRGGEPLFFPESFKPVDRPLYTEEVSYSLANAADDPSEKTVELPRYGKVILAAPEAGMWQVQVGDTWVTVSDETDATFEVTYAKVESLFVANEGTAKIRWISADKTVSSQVANVNLTYAAINIPVEAEATAYVANESRMVTAVAEEPGDEVSETIPVTVNYKLESGRVVANPYIANVIKGRNLSSSPVPPIIQGYRAAYVLPDDDTVDFVAQNGTTAASVKLNLKNIVQPIEYNVYYVPDFVTFTVKHMLIGLDGERANAVQTGDDVIVSGKKTDDPVGAGLELTETELPGFKALWYDDTTKLAADSSTEIKIFYERKMYLMLFDLDGGYGVDPIYAQFEAPISDGTPEKPGYTFLGWSLQDPETVDNPELVSLPATMPAANTTYYAVWEPTDLAKVSVVFWGQNADDDGYSPLGSSVIYAKPGTVINFETANTICGYEDHSHNEDCYDCGYVEHTHGPDCCSITAHVHGPDCCTIAVHSHSRTCYSSYNPATSPTGNPNNGQAPDNAVEGQVYRYYNYSGMGGGWRYYVYTNGTWYRLNSNTNNLSNGQILTPECGQTAESHDTHTCVYCKENLSEHEHNGTNCDYCELTPHEHSAECMVCTKKEHSHTDDCYITAPGLDSDLWTYETSTTVTVNADGSSVLEVKYKRVEYEITFYDGNTLVYTIKERWGANISDHWPIVNKNNNYKYETERWEDVDEILYDQVLVFIEIMPEVDLELKKNTSSNGKKTMNYYVEVLPGADYEHSYRYNNSTKYFNLDFALTPNYGMFTEKEDFFDLQGFTKWTSNPQYSGGSITGQSTVSHYYLRNRYDLVLNNGEEDQYIFTSDTDSDYYDRRTGEGVLYEDSLERYEAYIPTLPSYYEPGSREFAGWYLTPECTGEQIILENEIMPSENVTLFAKWELVEHDVTFYLKQEDIAAGTKLVDTFQVTHYDTVSETIEDAAGDDITGNEITIPTDEQMQGMNAPYNFVGWFYMDTVTNSDGTTTTVQKAFDPETMPITKDMEIYGVWNANQPVPFTVYYYLADENGNLLRDEDGNYIEVAETTSSKAFDGDSITLNAKTGNDLKEDYREGYFPNTTSHSLTIDINAESNEFIFKYVEAESVPYKVVYLIQQQDGSYIPYAENPEKIVDPNPAMVVTETYIPIAGYMPDEYQKTLAVTYGGTMEDDGDQETDPNENIIFFKYHEDTVNAFWTVTHYIEPIDGITATKDWIKYSGPSSETGLIGNEYTATTESIPGFEFSYEVSTVDKKYTDKDDEMDVAVSENLTETLTTAGIDFHLRYVRKHYPVKVLYLEAGTNKQLAPPELFDNDYDYESSVAITTDKSFDGYRLVSPNPETLGSVQIDGSTLETIQLNIITFYYEENDAYINYQVVGPTGCGTVKLGEPDSTAEPADFRTENVALLTGEAQGATAAVSSNTYKFVGWYSDVSCEDQYFLSADPYYQPTKAEGELWPETSTYFAKFEYNLTSLTITKAGKDVKANDMFVFTVSGGDLDNALQVTIKGTGSVTINGLTVGQTYTVKEVGYSFRYTPANAEQSKALVATAEDNALTFTNNLTNEKWLDATHSVDNTFEHVTSEEAGE